MKTKIVYFRCSPVGSEGVTTLADAGRLRERSGRQGVVPVASLVGSPCADLGRSGSGRGRRGGVRMVEIRWIRYVPGDRVGSLPGVSGGGGCGI